MLRRSRNGHPDAESYSRRVRSSRPGHYLFRAAPIRGGRLGGDPVHANRIRRCPSTRRSGFQPGRGGKTCSRQARDDHHQRLRLGRGARAANPKRQARRLHQLQHPGVDHLWRGLWYLDSYNPTGATRTVSLQFTQPIAGTGPNGGDPVTSVRVLQGVRVNVVQPSQLSKQPVDAAGRPDDAVSPGGAIRCGRQSLLPAHERP